MNQNLLTRIAEALERMAPLPAYENDISAANAFIWHPDPDRLEPVFDVARVDLNLLVGINSSRDILLENTLFFA